MGIAASVDGQNVATALNASSAALDNNWLNASEKRELNQYKLACQQQNQSACSKAAGLELLDKLRNKQLIDACVNGSNQQCKEQLALDPAAKQYGLENIGSLLFYRVLAQAGENGTKALAPLARALEKLSIKPLVDLKGNIQGWAVDVGGSDPATLKGIFGSNVYVGTEIILPTNAIDLIPLAGLGLKAVGKVGERVLVKETNGELIGNIDNVATETDALKRIANNPSGPDLTNKTAGTVLQQQSNKRFDELTNLFDKNNPLSEIVIDRKTISQGINPVNSKTTKILDSQNLTDQQIAKYAQQLAGDVPLVQKAPGVWRADLPGGEIITLRSVSSSAQQTGARWTIDVVGISKLQVAIKAPKVELKFR